MAELADAQDSGSCDRKVVQVQVLSSAPCLVDKNAVHGKTLKNDAFFRVFCCFSGKNATFVLRKNRFRFYAVFYLFLC